MNDQPMTSETTTDTLPESDQALPGDAASVADIPQVGDVTPRGVIAGVRLHFDGAIEISFNGSDFVAVA